MAFLRCQAQFYGFRSEFFTIKTFTQTHLYVADVFPANFRACVDQSGTATLLSAPIGAWCHLHIACYLRLVGHYCRKNREHYSILTHCIMEYLAGQYNGKTTLICEYM